MNTQNGRGENGQRSGAGTPLGDEIGRQARRKRLARKQPGPSPLRGLSTFGVIGWSVAVPTVAGALLGSWLNRVAPQDFSWTIALILGGVTLGALTAWHWIDGGGT